MARAPAKPAKAELSASTRVLILHGKDRFLQDEHLRRLREALVAAHGAEGVDTVRFDGAAGPRVIADVLDECRSFGLMQQHKVVLVENADLLLKADDDDAPPPGAAGGRGKKAARAVQTPRALLESYAEAPSDSATLVLRAGTWRPGNLDKAVLALPEGQGAVIKCEPPTAEQTIAWAVKRCQARHRSTISPQTAAMIVEAVGLDLGRIDSELEKLALAAGGNGEPITPELVRDMTGVTREDEFWSIQGSLVAGDAADTLARLRDLVEVSRHDPVPIMYSYLEMARKVHVAARGLADGRSPREIGPALKVWGPEGARMTEAILAAARGAGARGAAELFAEAVRLDAAGKSGLGEPVRNLEMLTLRFAHLTRPPNRKG